MIIKHNTTAMNANRQLGLVTGQHSKTTEKLSSGYQINRAADDAAGLSISEKMRRQIRGLVQASDNIEDGISLCQVADGALHETADILQRMRVLAVQSANGIYSERDRQSIDLEVAQLKNEVDRIAETTNFNNAVYPLKGTANITLTPEPDPTDGLIHEITVTIRADQTCTYEGKTYNTGDMITVTGLTTNDTEIWIMGASAFTDGIWASIKEPNNLHPLKKSDLEIDKDGYLYYKSKAGATLYAVYVTNPIYVGTGHSNPDPIQFESKSNANTNIQNKNGRFMTIDDLSSQKPATPPVNQPADNYEVIIQAGADSGEQISVQTVNATCKALGITDLTVATQESSGKALDLLNEAISKVITYRSVFGVTQNRLEYAKKVDDNIAENTQAAESRIRDTDMATAMVLYANVNILMQAGQSMLSQANKSKQDVLRLLGNT